jgi:hypothetical protein
LLEKAYAKLNQNYDRIDGGYGNEVLRTLTGAPTTYFEHEFISSKDLWKMHKHWAEMNYPQTASCCNEVAGGLDGLTNGHSYSLLDVKVLTNPDGTPAHRIAKMRNPWASELYNGKWSDKDSSWTDDFKKQVDLKVADDGYFWMPYENYVSFFWRTNVAFTQDWKTVLKDVKLSEEWTYFKIRNPVEQYLYVTAETYSPRNFPRASKCIPKHKINIHFMTASCDN